jgi:3-methyladenine DNA glycosylase AlkD
MYLHELKAAIALQSSDERAAQMSRFFKTGKGQYAEGDTFVGISMPNLRQIVKPYTQLNEEEVLELLQSPIHEYRMAALIWLVNAFNKRKKHTQPFSQEFIFDLYLNNLNYINNWDLVDVSCRDIVGAYLFDKDRSLLDELAQRPHLWSQRVAIVSTWYFIRKGQLQDTIRIATLLLDHQHDLIHKAVGWMLREAGDKDELLLEEFLETHIRNLHRTTLRYAIEHFNESKRKFYLAL